MKRISLFFVFISVFLVVTVSLAQNPGNSAAQDSGQTQGYIPGASDYLSAKAFSKENLGSSRYSGLQDRVQKNNRIAKSPEENEEYLITLRRKQHRENLEQIMQDLKKFVRKNPAPEK